MANAHYHYDGRLADGAVRGRGAQLNPGNRFERHRFAVDGEHLDRLATLRLRQQSDGCPTGCGSADVTTGISGELLDTEQFTAADGRQVQTRIYRDASRTVLNRVDSPDIGFDWSVNPYRGCEHGCVYCYARPTHETLGFSSGLDFETRIMAKTDAPKLLRKALSKSTWEAATIAMSGVTDPYQPIEAKLNITRGCLEVMAKARQPVSIITKSRLVLRDLDLLGELAQHNAVRVNLSITTLDNRLAGLMEPRASAPRDRLWAVRRLSSAGIPVNVMVAPIIPGLNDREVPELLRAIGEAGARSAGYVLLRLPWQNKQLFEDWLNLHFPGRKDHVLNLLRQTRNGKLYDSTWSTRLRGEGVYAEQIRSTFELFKRRYGLDRGMPVMNRDDFRAPTDHQQLGLFTGVDSDADTDTGSLFNAA